MKKSLLYLLIAVVGFTACNKDDDTAFDQSPDERLNETLATYQEALSGAPYGWRGLVFPTGANGGVFGFYFEFNDSNRVVMFADIDSTTSVTPRESSYRLKALQQPSLIFDTYSYLHILADPDASQNGGTYGEGLQSDFEFSLDSIAGDTIKLTGRFNGSKAMLIKATQAERSAYYNGDLATREFDNFYSILYYFKRLTMGGTNYDVQINQTNHTITFTWVDGSGNIQTFTTGYYYTVDGIGLGEAFNDGTNVITGFSNMSWDDTNKKLNFTINGTSSSITGVNTPVKVDVTAPQRWWNYAYQNGNAYWISVEGFHVNGVDDAYDIQSLATDTSSYYYLIYWPAYGTSGSTTYDIMCPVFYEPARNGLALYYAWANTFSFSNTNGRVTFNNIGTLGTTPTSGPAYQTAYQMYTSTWYFVQTSETTYDMVKTSDSRIWLTWEF